MYDLLVLSNVMLLILSFFYFCKIRTEQKSKHKIHDLFLNYKPEREIRNQDFINERFLNYVYSRTILSENNKFSKRGLKNLEYCFAEVLLNILNDYNKYQESKNEYMCVRLKTKFNKYLKYYSNCFYPEDIEIYLTLLGQRLIRNMCSCEIDLFSLYHIIYKITIKINNEHNYLIKGIENYLHNNELLTIQHPDIKIDKNEIFNLYKYCFKNISDN